MEPTQIKLTSTGIEVKIGQSSNGSLLVAHIELIQNLAVRRYDKRRQRWYIPVEEGLELLERFKILHPDSYQLDTDLEKLLIHFDGIVLDKFDHTISSDVLDELKTSHYDHQKQWLAFAQHYKAVANLCEQGTGKSKMAMDWVTLKGCRLVLLVCRNSNVYKWADEIRKHSDYRPFVLKGTRDERLTKLRAATHYFNYGGSAVAIINYDYIHPFAGAIKSLQFECIVLDESTAIKSTRTKRSKALAKMAEKVKYRLILTGTPLVNAPVDAFGQFRFLNPNIFGKNFFGFRQRYVIMGGYGGYQVLGYKNQTELSEKISRFSFRVLKQDCLDLPPKIHEYTDIEANSNFMESYQALAKATVLELGERMVDNTMAITKLQRCLQFCDGFMYVDEDRAYEEHASPKLDELFNFMDDHFESSNKLIIWAHYRATIDILEREVKQRYKSFWVEHLKGGATSEFKHRTLQYFNDAPHMDGIKKFCLILQTTSNCHGIDVLCDTSYYFGRSFNNEDWLQSQDRTHGINRGGEKQSLYIVPVMKGTIEVSVHKALQMKKSLSDLILRDSVSPEALLKGEI
jgi:SNF2 family DNA or RNA helicase